MPEEMTCFACEQEPTQQCPRCGRPYCDEHGEDVCDACLEPASGLPSLTLYRGSLVAILLGTLLAVWLILQPPGESADSAAAPIVVTPTEPAVVQTTPPPALATGSPAATTPGAQQTPVSAPTAPATQEPPAAAGTTTYTVLPGDTLFEICSNLSSLDPTECVERVLEINSISDAGAIGAGEALTIPLQ